MRINRNKYAEKQRKTIEWERLEVSSRKLEIPGNISCKSGHNKGQKLYGPNKAGDIKKRWQEHRRTIQKNLTDPDSHDGVTTLLEPDILECGVKWALGNIIMNKVSGGDGIPTELFQILKGDAVKVLHSMCQQIWKTQHWLQDWKKLVLILTPRKAMPKNVETNTQLHSSHTLVK